MYSVRKQDKQLQLLTSWKIKLIEQADLKTVETAIVEEILKEKK